MQPLCIGKELELRDNTDPLSKLTTTNEKFREIVAALKLQAEEQLPPDVFDETIIQYGKLAIQHYEKRSERLEKPIHLRTVNMINYHISEVLAESHHHEHRKFESSMSALPDRQRLRQLISKDLLQE